MDKKIHFSGKIHEGQMKISYRTVFDNGLKQLEGFEFEGEIWKKKKRRSNPQNAYLWGLVYPHLVAGFKDIGHEDVNKDIIHKWALEKFLDDEDFQVSSPHSGEVIQMRKTTTKLTTTQMMGYIASLQKFGAEFLGINIPDPDPIWNTDVQNAF